MNEHYIGLSSNTIFENILCGKELNAQAKQVKGKKNGIVRDAFLINYYLLLAWKSAIPYRFVRHEDRAYVYP